jgi:integrating conjugative element protein (TIGR03756 family)
MWYKWPWSIKISLKVKHYIPDYVISVYQASGENTWNEMSFLDIADSGWGLVSPFGLGSGTITSKDRSNSSTNITFKYATAIGNPLASVWDTIGFGYFLCDSEANSYVPAFLSSGDGLMWRTHPIEAAIYGPAQLLQQKNRITHPNASWPTKWGYLYPRTGFVVTTDDLKAASVVAYRTASIVTAQGNDANYHAANRPNMSDKTSQGQWVPKTVQLNNNSQGYFQMLSPRSESSCHLIGDMGSNPTSSLERWRSRGGNYAWNFWRPYKCCVKRGSKLIGHVGG